MLKNCLKLIVISFLFALPAFSSALDISECKVDTTIDLSNTQDIYIKQEIFLTNGSDQYVVEKLLFNFPYELNRIETQMEGRNVLNLYENKALEIDLFQEFIPPLTQKHLTISYYAKDLVTHKGGINSFYLPKFDYCTPQENSYSLKLPFDSSEIRYLSADYQVAPEGNISFNTSQDVYLNWGKLDSYTLSAQWKLDYGYFVPIPSATYSRVLVKEIPSGVRYFQDNSGNELFNLENGINYLGGYSAQVFPKDPLVLTYRSGTGFDDDVSFLDLPREMSITDIYKLVLDKYEPVLKRTISSHLPLNEITKLKQKDALMYAYTFARIAEAKGYQAEIYYGLVSLPISNELVWHFWVGIIEDEVMKMYDPFIEDLLGLPSFGDITPLRYYWGIFNKDVEKVPEAMHNTIASTLKLEYEGNDDSKVLGSSFLVDVFLNKPQDLSKKTELVITNQGSEVVYISSILLNDEYDITGAYRDLGILPQTAKVILFNSDIPTHLLLATGGELGASVTLQNNGDEYVLNTNTVKINAYVVYIAFMITLYLFFLGTVLLIKKNYRKLMILLPNHKAR